MNWKPEGIKMVMKHEFLNIRVSRTWEVGLQNDFLLLPEFCGCFLFSHRGSDLDVMTGWHGMDFGVRLV